MPRNLLTCNFEYAKDAFDRIDLEGVSATVERGERGGQCPEGCDGSVERGEAQLLLADTGEIMSKLRVSGCSRQS